MATITIHENPPRTLAAQEEVQAFLASLGVNYEQWPLAGVDPALMHKEVWDDADKTALLDAYGPMIEKLKAEGYSHCDVVAMHPNLPGLAELGAKFAREHYHEDDEVRFVVAGEGVFGFAPGGVTPFDVQVSAGDFVNVPKGVWHWFTLTDQQRIVAIRFFQDSRGWDPIFRDEQTATP